MDKQFWEYQILDREGRWIFASASGQEPHHYKTKEELMGILRIIHPGERVRLLCVEEVDVPGK